jgi:ATP sulfurylase
MKEKLEPIQDAEETNVPKKFSSKKKIIDIWPRKIQKEINVSDKYIKKNKGIYLSDLTRERNHIKEEIKDLKKELQILSRQESNEDIIKEDMISPIEKYLKQKWYAEILYRFQDGFSFRYKTLIDSGADVNCI